MEATILFADMVDSSTLSHVHDPHQYDEIVSAFQKTAVEVVAEVIKETERPDHLEAAVRGDELSLIVATVVDSDQSTDLDDSSRRLSALALQIAVRLKRRWLLTPENVRRVRAGQPPLGIAIGIHAGPVVVGKHRRFTPDSRDSVSATTAEGYAINLAKRVETAARAGRFSRVFLTRPIYNRTPSDFRQAFVRADVPQLKGLPAAPTIYEAKSIGHFDDRAFKQGIEFDNDENLGVYESIVRANPDEVWLLLDLAHKYFDTGEYEKAARKYESVIEVDPEFAPAHAYLGRAYLRDYRLPEAQSCLERAVELNPGQARANNYLAVCLRRLAVLALYDRQLERARELLQRAVHYHDRACRISAGEGALSFPWARNALNWTIAQCAGFESQMSLPYGIEGAYTDAGSLHQSIVNSPLWQAKQHLTLHSLGFIKLRQNQWGPALTHLRHAMAALDHRKGDSGLDEKGYAEKKSELLFHMGLCEYHENGLTTAIVSWQKAVNTITEAWGIENAHRACDGQYWIRHPIPDGRVGSIETLLKIPAKPDESAARQAPAKAAAIRTQAIRRRHS